MKRPETAQETFLYQHQQYKRKIHFLRIFIFMVFLRSLGTGSRSVLDQ